MKRFLVYVLLFITFLTGLTATTAVSVAAVDVNCGDTANTNNLRCQSSLFGARCFFPLANNTSCSYEYSIVGGLLDFFVALSPYFAVIVILYSSYLYYSGVFEGDDKRGRLALINAAYGLVITLSINVIRQFIISFSSVAIKNNSLNTAQQTTLANIASVVVTKVLAPIFIIMIYAAGTFALVSIVYAGYRYITGGRDGAEEGLKIFRNALIGLLLAFLAASIVGIIQNFFGGNGLFSLS